MASQPSPAQDYGASRNDSFFSAKSYSVSFAGSPGEREPLVLPKHQFPSGSAGYAGTAAGLVNTLGVKFCIMLIIGQCWVKGFISSMDSTMQPYIFASYHVPAPQVLIYQGVISIPWCMKPLFGILSDAVPLCGLSRAPYILNATLCGCAAFFVIGSAPEGQLEITTVVACLLVIQLQISVTDLLIEARYSEVIQQKCPDKATTVVGFVQASITMGGILATLSASGAIQFLGTRRCYLVLLVLASFIIVPLICNYMEEKPRSVEEVTLIRKRLAAQPQLIFLCLVFFLISLLLSVVGILYQDPFTNCVLSVGAGLVLLACLALCLQPVIAKFACFALIQAACSWTVSSASFYFYTDPPHVYPNGPHFSVFFYTTVLGTVSLVFSLLGLAMYERYLRNGTYRFVMVSMNVVYTVLHLMDAMLYSHMNRRLGVPDRFWVLGASVLGNVVQQWTWMPLLVAVSHLCPRGMEAIMFSLLAACMNIGWPIASSCSALLLQHLGVAPTGGPENEEARFEHLWYASVICCIAPVVAVIVLLPLLPDAKQNERLIQDPNFEASTGSPLSVYMGWQ